MVVLGNVLASAERRARSGRRSRTFSVEDFGLTITGRKRILRLVFTERIGHRYRRMPTSPTALSEIYSFRAVNDRLGTAGQPTEGQFRSIRESGFDAVINLALPTSDNALEHEGSIVTGFGMSYVHIPVDFKAPAPRDFLVFCRVMEAFQDRRVFVHCAANMRVSAFVFLYRVLQQGVPRPEAERDLYAIWQPDEVWSRFIQDQLNSK